MAGNSGGPWGAEALPEAEEATGAITEAEAADKRPEGDGPQIPGNR